MVIMTMQHRTAMRFLIEFDYTGDIIGKAESRKFD